MLNTEASAALRNWLIAQISDLAFGGDAAIWAHRSLSEKNKLTTADAQRVEEAFQASLTAESQTLVTSQETRRHLKAVRMGIVFEEGG